MNKQNEVWSGVNSGVDLKKRISQIVEEITKKSKFIPDRLLGTSSWWNGSTGVGAFHLKGKFEEKEAVLKVQGVKLATSEVDMIQSFAKQNKSKIIRPPRIYEHFPWDDKARYETFVLEDVGNKNVVDIPTTEEQVKKFFDLYTEYRNNCRNIPWVSKPDAGEEAFKEKFEGWRKTSQRLYPNHPLRQSSDIDLIDKAVKILIDNSFSTELEFMHGHFSTRDLFVLGDEVVLLSNLYWSWRPKYYDLIFGYHWYMYSLIGDENMTPEVIELQRELWLSKIDELAPDKKALKLALLERAVAGLNLDSLNLDTTRDITRYVVAKTREIVEKLIEELS